MLYDPKRDACQLVSLIGWLEQQPADKEYFYANPTECMMCQYFSALGYQMPIIDSDYVHHGAKSDQFFRTPPVFEKISKAYPQTFGAALARAKALQP